MIESGMSEDEMSEDGMSEDGMSEDGISDLEDGMIMHRIQIVIVE